jgi:hypothetical protein
MAEEVQNQEAPAQEVPAQEAQEAPAAPDLNISDLIALRSIVEVASQRGAFKATELEAVGKTFNKLNTFLESVTKKEE